MILSLDSSAVQNGMTVAGEERYIDEEGKADAEESNLQSGR